MANPILSGQPAALTGDPLIDSLTTGFKWTLGADRTIDWSMSKGFLGETVEAIDAVRSGLQQALDSISVYANVRFNYLGDFADPDAAGAAGSDINVAFSDEDDFFAPEEGDDPDKEVLGFAFFPTTEQLPEDYASAPGDVLLNVDSSVSLVDDFDAGGAAFALLLHELGHALGLKHPHDDGGTDHPTLESLDAGELDADWATVMSYNDPYPEEFGFNAATPLLLDVMALRALYGPNLATNAGSDVHTLRARAMYNTVWDAAGHDVISAAGSIRGWIIALPDAMASTTDPVRFGLAVPSDERDLPGPQSLTWLLGDIEDAQGSDNDDEITGSRLANRLDGAGGDDTVFGGQGGDTIVDSSGSNYLRGDEGDDSIQGGVGFDDINGNMGADTASGGLGSDWVVGGKDDDRLFGDAGDDLVYGNLGADTCDGGEGADTIRGGQQDDILTGGAGNDYLSGDRDSDTISGGGGADIFHSFSGAGLDRVLDFNRGEGDRVLLDPGTTYTVFQSGSDTIIDMGGDSRLVLMGVSMSSLTGDWISVG